MDDRKQTSGGGFPDYVVYILIVLVGGLIIIVGILACVVFCRRRKRKIRQQQTYRQEEESISMTSPNNRERDTSVTPPNIEWTPELGPQTDLYPAVEREDLMEAYSSKHADGDRLFKQEYKAIPRCYDQYSSVVMDAVENKRKNRYPKEWVSTYDYCRVRLHPTDSDSSCDDYINANYVKQANGKKNYIVTQAPLKSTQNDFWRMVWDNEVSIIIMLCDLWRGGVELSYHYWPDDNCPSRCNTYGDLKVTAVGCQQYADHTVRTFKIENMAVEGSKPRTAFHFHYTDWIELPENQIAKVPKVHAQILKFVKKINQYEKKLGRTKIPLVVHCSGGTAETGVYLALDELMDELAEQNKVDLYNCVARLRQQRPNTVHFAGQYSYVFRTLLEEHLYGDTEVDANDLRDQVFKDTTIRRLLNQQFQDLKRVPIEKRPTTIGQRKEHSLKNRYPELIIPFDDNMVPVTPRAEQPDTTYINASWVDGYWQKQAFIVTQDPQRDTAPEFWRMIWEHHVTAVVMLTEPGPEPTECYHYWPHDDESQVCYENIVVRHEPAQRRECPGYSLRRFTVSNKAEPRMTRRIYQFHYHEWPDGSVPQHATSLLDMIVQLRSRVSKKQPVAVHCSGGGDRSSVFCAVNLSIDQLTDIGKVDIFQTTRLLRHQRQYMIPTITEYEFLYKTVLQYIEMYWDPEDDDCSHLSDRLSGIAL